MAGKSDILVIYNDVASNLHRDFAQATDSFYVPELANPILMRLGKKRNVSRSYLFGQPNDGEYNLLLSDSGYIDDQQLYATVIRQTKGKETKTKIAWVQL